MAENNKITESELLAIVSPGETLLSWLKVFRPEDAPENVRELEIVSNKKKPGRPKRYRFEVAPRLDCTPKAVQKDYMAEEEARAAEGDDYINKLFIYPYLYPKSQRILAGMSGKEGEGGEELSWVDLSGNGAVVVPGSLYVKCLVNYNKKPQSRALANPYAGLAGMVGRTLIVQQEFSSLKELCGAVCRGMNRSDVSGVSVSQVSKALTAFEEDLVVSKIEGKILLKDWAGMLDNLAKSYKPIKPSRTVALRLPEGTDWKTATKKMLDLKWAVAAESTVGRYTAFAEGGPIRVFVLSPDFPDALRAIGGVVEDVPNFADIVLMETNRGDFESQAEEDEQGIVWAGPIQTWLELQAGDARQQDAAAAIRRDYLQSQRLKSSVSNADRDTEFFDLDDLNINDKTQAMWEAVDQCKSNIRERNQEQSNKSNQTALGEAKGGKPAPAEGTDENEEEGKGAQE